ncbi:MAG: T9SS type A sorting domain-containing protein [Bacteroidales bacterium]|nr:T9SS type A sorting domain-containing protein [Bacteroidales bacterium]
MKKSLLSLTLMLALASMAMAQDVYTSGYCTNEAGYWVAAVYKNGELLYSTSPNATLDHDPGSVLYLDGDVYWVDNCNTSDNDYNYGDVFRNGERWLSNPVGSQSFIRVLFTDGTDVYAGGNILIDGVLSPVIWKNDNAEPYLVFNSGESGAVYHAVMVDGVIFACGVKYVGSGSVRVGAVWGQDAGELLSFGMDDIPMSIAVYNGDIYTAVTNVNSHEGKVYANSQELFTLASSGHVTSIVVDAGDIYASGIDLTSYNEKIWKNGNLLHEKYSPWGVPDLAANSEGVYYAVNGGGTPQVWKDGQLLHTNENCDIIWGIAVDTECHQDSPLTLPFFDGFENGQTDWTCMGQWDVDQHNDGEASYWHRGGENLGVSPATGHHCAWHRYNSTYEQEGRLSLPLIDIPSGGQVTLSFKTYEQYPDDYGRESVWVSRYNINHEPQEVWTQTSPSAEWKTVNIDLSDYQGYVVDIYFEYKGENAHNWYIDDVSITQTVGVNESEDGGLAVYPNPAADCIRIDGLEANSEVRIFNTLGELVKTASVGPEREIGIGELASGLYFVRVGAANLRFVKE